MKKIIFILFLVFFLISCNDYKKEKGGLFCNSSILSEGSGCSLETLLDYSSFIKVGQTFTFSGINYLDKYSMPLQEKKVTLKVTFNDNNTITFEDDLGNTYNNTVICAWAEQKSFVFEDEEIKGSFYEIDFNLDEGAFCKMFRQLPNSNCGKNEFGINYTGDYYIYYTGPSNSTVLYPFEY